MTLINTYTDLINWIILSIESPTAVNIKKNGIEMIKITTNVTKKADSVLFPVFFCVNLYKG